MRNVSVVYLIWTRRGSFFQSLENMIEFFFAKRMFKYFARIVKLGNFVDWKSILKRQEEGYSVLI